VPRDLFCAPKRQITLFLRHLWSRLGSVHLDPAGQSGSIALRNGTRPLYEDVSRLLLRFGIQVGIKEIGGQLGLVIEGVDSQRRFLQEIGVMGSNVTVAQHLLAVVRANEACAVDGPVWGRLRDAMEPGPASKALADASAAPQAGVAQYAASPTRPALERVATIMAAADLELSAVNDVLWDTVAAVEPDGVEEVYDATVLDTHNFIANGIAVHNSIEQDADVVILLHRDRSDPTREGEADVIVAKHRNGPTKDIVLAFQGHYSRFANMAQDF
jgi:replicative DNA helicase